MYGITLHEMVARVLLGAFSFSLDGSEDARGHPGEPQVARTSGDP